MENKQEQSTTQGQTSDQSINSAEAWFNDLGNKKAIDSSLEREGKRNYNKKRKKIHASIWGRRKRITIKLGKYGFSSFVICSIIGFIMGGRD